MASVPTAPPSLNAMPGGWDDEERAALVALLRLQPEGLSWQEIAVRVASVGSARVVWDDLTQGVLFDVDGATEAARQAATEDVDEWRQAQFRFLTFMDADYPVRLRDVRQIPPVIFTRGDLLAGDRGVSVVGSRAASDDGRRFASRVAQELAARGLTTVSGLAAGIDTAAHVAALDAGGRTVAVIGTGITRWFPEENRELHERIAADGLLLSQFWPDAPPTRFTFPMRNAVMSAYGHATVVVEAGEKSGARIQAREAVQHGRPVVLSREVVRRTRWGAAMVGSPGVRVADSPEEAIECVEAFLRLDDTVGELLSLAGG